MSREAQDAVDAQALPEESFQFRLSSLFWITIAMAIAMAYGRRPARAELQMAFAYAAFAPVMTGIIGTLCRYWNDTAFWSIVVTLIAFIAVAGHPMPNQSIAFGWGLVGAGCGALCGARVPKRVWKGVLASGVLGTLLMNSSILFARVSLSDVLTLFDVASAGVVGGLTRLFIELIGSLIQMS